MKAFQKILACMAALLIGLSLRMPVLAAEPDSAERSWEEISAAVMAEYGMTEDGVYAGYLNLVTGEEHYINGDDYFRAASMYKVPLCMYFAEHLGDGTIDWSIYEQYFTFESVRDAVLIDSDNEQAMFLFNTFLGGYDQFRILTQPYMGVEPGSELIEVTMYNNYTPREFINCLQLLYNEPERFPGIIETMQKAMTNRFFKLNEPRFRIAHKPGWMSPPDYYVPVLNDCAICFTTQPIALVMFTNSYNTSEEFLSAWCTAMCEYTERMANKPTPTPEPTPVPTVRPTPATSTSAPTVSPEPVPERASLPVIVPEIAVGLFFLLGFVFILVLCVKYRARFIGLFLALLLSASAMLLAAVGLYRGTVYARPSGEPAESVAQFFNAICTGDYGSAYRELRDYSDLGLGEEPASPAGQRIYRALHESYSYALAGECRSEMLEATQPVRFTYLDLASLENAVAEETQRQAEKLVQSRSIHEVYDENKRYRPEVANEAYLAALDLVLQSAPSYYTETAFDISLAYTDGRWQILTSPALLRALTGGIG